MNPQDVDTFMTVTGCTQAVAVQSLTVHGGDINRAIDAFFNNDGAAVTRHGAEAMEEDVPLAPATLQHFVHPQPPYAFASQPQQSILPPSRRPAAEPSVPWSFRERGRPLPTTSGAPRVALPPDVRDVPIEWHDDADDNVGPRRSHSQGVLIEEVTAADFPHDILNAPAPYIGTPVEEVPSPIPILTPAADQTSRPQIVDRHGYRVPDEYDTFNPNAPVIAEVSGGDDDDFIQDQMLQAAIEASKREAELASQRGAQVATHVGSQTGVGSSGTATAEDDDLARAVSLSLKTAEQEKELRELGEASRPVFMVEDEDEDEQDKENLRRLALLRGDTATWSAALGSSEAGGRGSGGGSSSVYGQEARGGVAEAMGDRILIEEIDEPEEEQPLVRRPRRHNAGTAPSGSAALPALSVLEALLPARPQPSRDHKHDVMVAHDDVLAGPSTDQHGTIATGSPQRNGSSFPDEWGGISSEEHDEAVMIEAALFGGLSDTDMGLPFQHLHPDLDALGAADNMYNSRRILQQPSPAVVAQRRIREQQDGEFLQSLAADREKELRASQEAEVRRRQEEAAAAAAQAQQERRRDEQLRVQHAQEELARQLAAKKASLPPEPASGDDTAVNLLVRMPDSSRRGRRFRKSDKLHVLFDFLDCSEDVKPGSYRLVTPFPRRVLTDKEHESSFASLGLSSKQELLNLELI